jgi:hypothetical protein
MKNKTPIILILAILAIGAVILLRNDSGRTPQESPASTQTPAPSKAPRFEDYPPQDHVDGTPAQVIFVEGEPAWQFRTVIRKAAAEGPNFAGRYTVASWGCGTACQQNAVIDAADGRITAFNLMTTGGVEYRLASRLLIAYEPSSDGLPADAERGIPSYYLMEHGDLVLQGRIVDGAYKPFVP